jgi:hypothetical protein
MLFRCVLGAAGQGSQGTGPDLPTFVLSCAAMAVTPVAMFACQNIAKIMYEE